MSTLSPVIRLFISSTFVDFAFEREVLQRAVFPQLRDLCAKQGCRFQPIDLRWGINEDAGNNRQTLAICLEEIARCQRLSPDLNCLILLGERYGSCFLPERIPSDQVARLLPQLAASAPDAYDAFLHSYKEDLNAQHHEFVLLPRAAATTAADQQEEEVLRQALVQAAQLADFSNQELLPFVASVTHLEIQRALLDAGCDPKATLCAIRTLDTPTMPHSRDPLPAAPSHMLESLTSAVVQRLEAAGREHMWRYHAASEFTREQAIIAARQHDAHNAQTRSDNFGDPHREITYEQYATLAKDYYTFLEPHIQQALARRQAAAQASGSVAAVNRQFAAARAAVVFGREAERQQVAAYLANQTPIPLVVTGPSGVGKSTLLARAEADARAAHPRAIIVTRYIGVTPETSSLADLLSGLLREIAAQYGQPEPEAQGDLAQLVKAVARQLGAQELPEDRPLFLFIDALDQLGPQRLWMSWLPSELAPNVRIIVSILPEREELADLRRMLPATQILYLGPLTRAEGARILQTWLAEERRTLTSDQERVVLNGFTAGSHGSRESGIPLYLRLAFEQARLWRSFDPVQPLAPTVPDLIAAYLTKLEEPAQHGARLVAYALGYLAAARHGLAEDELLDVLSQSETVREEMHSLNRSAPAIDAQLPLPVALWARLAANLERYLTEHEADASKLVTFYHRQVRDVIEHRYLSGSARVGRHEELAVYFAKQPYQLSGGNTRLWNRRKLAESAYQQEAAGPVARDALEATLTDGRFLEGSLTVAGVTDTLDELARLSSSETIRHIATLIRASAVVLATDPAELTNQIHGRGGNVAWMHDLPERTTPWMRLKSHSLNTDPALLNVLQGHHGSVTCCALSEDGQRALSGAEDRMLRVWETATGTTQAVLQGHTDVVSDCALSADGKRALSASKDGTLLLWDVTSGSLLYTMQGRNNGHKVDRLTRVGLDDGDIWRHHESPVICCALSANGRLALSAFEDETLRVWDTSSGTLLGTLEGHEVMVTDCALSADGKLALTASEDRTLRLWDTTTCKQLHSWGRPYMGNPIFGCALSGDGQQALCSIALPDFKGELQLYDTTRGRLLQTLELQGTTSGCALSPDGRLALVISSATQGFKSMLLPHLQVWDMVNGRLVRTAFNNGYVVNSCAVSADRRVALTACLDGTLRMWDTAAAQTASEPEGHSGWVYSCAVSADGKVALSASADRTLRVWDTASGHLRRTLSGHTGAVFGCALSADGRLALSSSLDRTLRLWDTTNGRLLRIFKHRSAVGVLVAWIADAIRTNTDSTDTFMTWLIGAQAIPNFRLRDIFKVSGYREFVLNCTLSADGRWAIATSSDGKLRRWNVISGRQLNIMKRPIDSLNSCALSADGLTAVYALKKSRSFRLWDIAQAMGRTIPTGHVDELTGCALSGDGTLALTSSRDQTLKVWEPRKGLLLQTLRGHTSSVDACALDFTGQVATSVSSDRRLCLWNTATGDEIAHWRHDVFLKCCAASADGHLLVAGDFDGGVHFLGLEGREDAPKSPVTNLPRSWLAEKESRKPGILGRFLGSDS